MVYNGVKYNINLRCANRFDNHRASAAIALKLGGLQALGISSTIHLTCFAWHAGGWWFESE